MRNTHASTKYLTRKDRELELVKVFKFSDKIPGFSALSKFLYGILHYLSSITKL